MNEFSKMMVHWLTYNHCLFGAYLASVAIECGWISDAKFQIFSDKDMDRQNFFPIWIRS